MPNAHFLNSITGRYKVKSGLIFAGRKCKHAVRFIGEAERNSNLLPLDGEFKGLPVTITTTFPYLKTLCASSKYREKD